MYLKDKEDLSYPEPPVLDMKWENCDANVAEQVNIPKFSKLDNIETPFRFFELFFDNALIHMSVGYTMFMVMQSKQILVLKLLMKHSHKFPNCKLHW